MNDETTSPIVGLRVDNEHPYLGLESYQEEYKDYFFGRSKDTQQLLRLVQRNTVTVLSGKSGLGKTSLIKAGLMPKLRELDYFPVYLRLNFDDPRVSVLDLLKSSIFKQVKHIDQTLPEFNCQTLWEYFHKYKILNGYAIPVFIFDQFEELFTRGQKNTNERQDLITEISDLVENQIPLSFQQTRQTKKILYDIIGQNYRILFSLREDYLAKLETLSVYMPSLKKSRYRIVQMTGEQALEAITQPGKAIITEEESKMILKLIFEIQLENVHREDILHEMEIEPFLLSLICYHINDLRIQRKETKISGELLKSIKVRNIIEEFYNRSMDPLSQKAHNILEEKLLTKDGFRKLQPKSDLIQTGVISDYNINYLIDKRILRKEIWSGREHVELIHDILIPVIKEKQSRREAEKKRARSLFYAAIVLFGVIFLSSAIWAILLNRQHRIVSKRNDQLNIKSDSLELVSAQKDSLRIIAELEKDTANIKRMEAEKQKNIAEKEKEKVKEQKRIVDKQKGIAEIQKKRAEESLAKIKDEQLQENKRTMGRLKVLKNLSYEDSWRSEDIINNVATYLWFKGGKASLDTLIRLLQEYEEYIPDDYGLKIPDEQMLLVQDSLDWPLTLTYNPDRTFNRYTFTYSWQKLGRQFASLWGIPVPRYVRFNEDRILSIDQMKISAPGEEDIFFTLPEPEGYIMFTKNAVVDKNLLEFIEVYGDEWMEYKALKRGGPWYLAPKWTLPIFKIGGHSYYSGENKIALVFAHSLLDHPEILLNENVTKLLLSNVYKKYPITVAEALNSRNGLEVVRKDLIEVVKNGYGLLSLEQDLDFLADHPDESSYSAVSWVNNTIDVNELMTEYLQGRRKRNSMIEITSSYFEGSFQRYLDNYKNLQPFPKPPIRIYTGANIHNRFYKNDHKYQPKLKVLIEEVRTDFFRKFGIVIPSLQFYYGSSSLSGDEIMIEVLNQNESDESAVPFRVNPDSCFEILYKELYNRAIRFRINWITPDMVESLLYKFSDDFVSWFMSNYTITDMKNILRSVINPENEEMDYYSRGLDDKAREAIPTKNSLYNVEWLVRSLVFWLQTDIDRLNIDQLREVLIRTQNARLFPKSIPDANPKTLSLVKKGMEKLAKGSIQDAQNSFKEAIKMDHDDAINVFLHEYPNYCSMDIKFIMSYPIIPGKINLTWPLSSSDIRNLELYMEDYENQLDQKNYFNLLIILLHNYLDKEYYGKADNAIKMIEKLPNQDNWSTTKKYLVGYYFLMNNKRFKTSPTRIHDIEELLSESFRLMSESELEKIYAEIIDLVKTEFTRLSWSNNLLLKLARQRPENYWVNYLTANLLGQQNQFELINSAFELLDKAESTIPERDKASSLAWLNLERGRTYYSLSSYTDNPEWTALMEKGISMLVKLINEIPTDDPNWPRYDMICSPLYGLYTMNGEIDKAEAVITKGLASEPDNINYLSLHFFTLIAKGDMKEALSVAKTLSAIQPDNINLLIAQIMNNDANSEYSCNQYLETNHEYNDYVRLWLYYYLAKNGPIIRAKAKLEERWEQIDSTSWIKRLRVNDNTALGEIWIGYYLNKVDEKFIFEPLKDMQTFKNHPFSNLDSYMGFKCEAFCYKALLLATQNSQQEYIESLETVLSTNFYSYYEYQLAKYLLNEMDLN